MAIGSEGTSVATETCGQVRPLKFSITLWAIHQSASICVGCGFGPTAVGGGSAWPFKKAMLLGPPPNDGLIGAGGSGPPGSGAPGAVEIAMTIVWVIV